MTALLLLALVVGAAPPVAWLLPVRPFALAPRGITVDLQAWVARHPDNRWVQLEVWLDDLRVQASGWSIDGADAAAIQPTSKPLTTTHLAPGRYELRARVCAAVTDDSGCARERARATMPFHVCGPVETPTGGLPLMRAAQPPEASLGRFPNPPIVGMTGACGLP